MKLNVLALFLLAFCSAGVFSAEKVADISHKELVDAVSTGKVVLIDCNGSDSFAKHHIPGAVDFATAKADLATKLPSDKAALVVAYCGNEQCNAYQFGADAAAGLGYTNVKHYPGGIAGWLKAKEKVEGTDAK